MFETAKIIYTIHCLHDRKLFWDDSTASLADKFVLTLTEALLYIYPIVFFSISRL